MRDFSQQEVSGCDFSQKGVKWVWLQPEGVSGCGFSQKGYVGVASVRRGKWVCNWMWFIEDMKM